MTGIVMTLRFGVELLLLLATDRLCGKEMRLWRGILAAMLGGLHAGICVAAPGTVLGAAGFQAAVITAMAWMAFGIQLRQWLLFGLINMAIAGAGTRSIWGAVGAAGAVLLLCIRDRKGGCVSVELWLNGRSKCFRALQDTGNTLIDPMTGRRVLVAGADIAREMLGLTADELRRPIETMQQRRDASLRLIPYRAVGSGGMLLAVKPEHLRIGRDKREDLVAFAPQELTGNGTYQALAGGI